MTAKMIVVMDDSALVLDMLRDALEAHWGGGDLSYIQKALVKRVVWLERLPERPIRGVVLANEVLDALPCQRFVVAGADVEAGDEPRGSVGEAGAGSDVGVRSGRGGPSVLELGVSVEGDAFVERLAPPDSALAAACESLLAELPQPLPPGYTSEVCLRLEAWLASVGECLERGLILLFDYGLPRSHYYHPQRTAGTLRCHYKQRAHDDPCINVGVQDITAWVDFTRVAEAAVSVGLDVSGFCTQAAFLLATGIEGFVAEAVGVVEQTRRAGEARRLLMPGEMGEAFKVMALTRDYDASPGGFALQDLRHSL